MEKVDGQVCGQQATTARWENQTRGIEVKLSRREQERGEPHDENAPRVPIKYQPFRDHTCGGDGSHTIPVTS